jgi:hypothetical protein
MCMDNDGVAHEHAATTGSNPDGGALCDAAGRLTQATLDLAHVHRPEDGHNFDQAVANVLLAEAAWDVRAPQICPAVHA